MSTRGARARTVYRRAAARQAGISSRHNVGHHIIRQQDS
eukprot:SAG31_NODE_11910_length_987_cov_0.826577_2_plen_38_part_01